MKIFTVSRVAGFMWLWLLSALVATCAEPGPLQPEAARERMVLLRGQVAYHDELYYKKSAPEITDAAYDALKRELSVLEQQFPALAVGISPTDSLGDDRNGTFQLYRHRERMQSLAKSYTESELRGFNARLGRQLQRNDLVYIIEPKFDGLAVSVTYERGKLVRAVTRGNGIEGDEVTVNALTIADLPRELRAKAPDGSANPVPDVIELRGEVYLPWAEFKRINVEREAAGEAPFAHPRNLAAGTLKLSDPREVAPRKLALVLYGWGAWLPSAGLPVSQRAFHAQVRAWGLPSLAGYSVGRSADEVWAAVQEFDRLRPGLAFPVDGAVVKLDAVALRAEVGATEHAPRWATAYKFAPDRAETQLLAITVQVGRSGVLTPVAELSPVSLGGAVISRATLHNADEIARGDFRVGDFVYVEKAGEIIPAIVGVNVARRAAVSRPFQFPNACPSCQADVVRVAGESAVRCPNSECSAQLRRRVQHFASEAGVEIEGLGPALIDALVTKALIRELPDLYRLRRDDLSGLPGVGATSADRLVASIERSKRAELSRFIYGLSLPQIGPFSAKALARRFRSLGGLASADTSEFAEVLGPSSAAALAAYFQSSRVRATIAELLALGVAPVASFATSTLLAGKTFVLTGTLPSFTRAQAEAKIVAAGGKVAGSVSRNTSYVLAGEGSGAKLDAARALGVAVIEEAAWLTLIGEN